MVPEYQQTVLLASLVRKALLPKQAYQRAGAFGRRTRSDYPLLRVITVPGNVRDQHLR